MQSSSCTWRLVLCLFILVVFNTSCKKEGKSANIPGVPHPVMEYVELHNRVIKSNSPAFSIDVNKDGRKDIVFATQWVGDPVQQVDKLQFLVNSNIAVNLPVNTNEEIPVLKDGAAIVAGDFDGYQWFELSSIVLVQKIISVSLPPVWEGHWKNALSKYLPYQLITNGERFNGWVELSVDITGEKITLHRAAISKEPNKTVRAGQ